MDVVNTYVVCVLCGCSFRQALPVLLVKFQAEPLVVECLLPLACYLQPQVIGLAPSKLPFQRLLKQLQKLLLEGSPQRAPAVCASFRHLLSGCDHSRADDVVEALQEVRSRLSRSLARLFVLLVGLFVCLLARCASVLRKPAPVSSRLPPPLFFSPRAQTAELLVARVTDLAKATALGGGKKGSKKSSSGGLDSEFALAAQLDRLASLGKARGACPIRLQPFLFSPRLACAYTDRPAYPVYLYSWWTLASTCRRAPSTRASCHSSSTLASRCNTRPKV